MNFISFGCSVEDLATATALAIIYIENRSEAVSEDNDIKALESICECLSNASLVEQKAVADALVRLGCPDLVDGMGLVLKGG